MSVAEVGLEPAATKDQEAPRSPFAAAAAAVAGEPTPSQKQEQAPLSHFMLGCYAIATLVHALVLPKALRLLAYALTAAPHADGSEEEGVAQHIASWGRPARLLLSEVSAWLG